MNICINVADLTPRHRSRLESALAGHPLVFLRTLADEGARAGALAKAEIVFGNVPAAALVAGPVLRWAQLDSAGFDSYLGVNAARSRPILITHLKNFFAMPVAESVLAGVLAFHRQLPLLLRAQPEKRWIKTAVEPTIGQLHGARVLILGAGAIGRKVAALLAPFDTTLRFFARRAPDAQVRTLGQLDAALPSTDLLINTLPQTPETVGLLSRSRLALLPASALVVNVGRGSAVDEDALVEALDGGRLGGAVLDVTAIEPLPATSRLWTHPKVILTQHTGGRFPGEVDAKIDRFLENFARFARGEELHDQIDAARGY
ncbi:MAG: hydroxyacid dehydrogenase [Verrucomicrobia bacterium]|nr:hydroxyacid dehydrogenase [Verrucomicrobiota bacterium]